MGPIFETPSLTAILDSTNDGVFVLDSDRRFIYFNKACERLTGRPAADVLAQTCQCSELTHCQDEQGRSLAGMLCPGLAVFDGRGPAARQRMQIRSSEGEPRWVETHYTAIRDADGRPRCIIGVMRDNSEARKRERDSCDTVQNLRAELDRLQEQQQERFGFTALLTRSPVMREVLEKIEAACRSSSPVLIVGESGTGKELIARTIHQHGSRSDKPFVAAGVASAERGELEKQLFGATALEGGLFAAAEGGSLLLEDIDAFSAGAQLRLLRVLQDHQVTPPDGGAPRPVDVRLIASARRPLSELLASGTLRQDLYYRLGAITIEVPPLRARPEDIPLLVRHFLDELNGSSARQVHEIELEVWPAMLAHHWPGNIRELYGMVESSFAQVRDGCLRADDLRFWPRVPLAEKTTSDPQIQLDDRIADIERQTIFTAIKRAGGQRNLAARMMGISRSRLYRRMEALGIKPDQVT